MKWKKEIKEVGWYWICQFHNIHLVGGKPNIYPIIFMLYVEKNKDGNYFSRYGDYDWFDFSGEDKDEYCFMGPIEKPEQPVYKTKKVKGKLIAEIDIEKENKNDQIRR